MSTDIIDTTAEELPDGPGQSTAVVRRERRSEVIRPLDADALVESFHAYQQLLPRLLTNDDYQDAGRGERFVKKSGWRKIATAFDLDVQIISSEVDRGLDGAPMRAEVVARAIAPSGRAMDGDGYCSADEARFAGPRGNRSKLENDLRATATTRAMNRAISGLVGMGAVSAEEVDGGAPPLSQATPELKREVRDVIEGLIGDKKKSFEVMNELGKHFGTLPAAAGEAILLVGKALAPINEPPAPAPAPAPETDEQRAERLAAKYGDEMPA